MKRRHFIIGLTAATGWPLAARAQRPGKPLPVIGFIGAGTRSGWNSWTAAFVQHFAELGWVDGKTVSIEYRWADGDGNREIEIADEFARMKVDVLVTVGGGAARQATSEIPIVFAISSDPLGTGLVKSLARPGGNITGLSIQSTDLAGKRLELLRELLPDTRKVAILADFNLQASVLELNGLLEAGKNFGIDVFRSDIGRTDDIPPAVQSLKGRTDAIYVPPNRLANANRVLINESALAARLPTMFGFRPYVQAGGLLSYGPNTEEMFRRAAEYVDKILRGTKPADLPVEQPTKFDLIVNLKTARTLGIAVPPTLLARADEVIE